MQVIFREKATNRRALLGKMNYEDKASYDSTPPCISDTKLRHLFETYIGWRRLIGSPMLQIIFHKRATEYRSLLRKTTYQDKGPVSLRHPVLGSSILEQHTATHCNTLQHTATHCVLHTFVKLIEDATILKSCTYSRHVFFLFERRA